VILDLAGSAYYTVGHSGLILWPSALAGTTVEELAGLLVERFSLDPQLAERDVLAFIAALEEAELLESQP
jgi:hypothetical protein